MINDIWCFACNYERTEQGVKFNDQYTIDGNIATRQGLDCMKQLCAQSLWLWWGEWVMNKRVGVTYKRILGKIGNQQSLVKHQITNAIMNINNFIPKEYQTKYGIKKVIVNNYNLERSSKQLSIDVYVVLQSNVKFQVVL